MNKPGSILENGTYKFLCDFDVDEKINKKMVCLFICLVGWLFGMA